ncbi:MAG TPA: hypothetical protein VFJ84_00455 [Candidatus Saccharimonadales bacterium]|nr:hypothetical protein [Candidatus Saccharimonadales bacterium]
MIYPGKAEFAVENVRGLDTQAVTQAARLLLEKAQAKSHIGSGCEKDVFDYDGHRVISFFTHASLEPRYVAPMVKTFYYSAKLGHLLLPDNIPDAHLALASPPAIIFDRVYGERDNITLEERHGFRLMLERIGITQACDLADGNLIRRPDGSLAYVDTVNAGRLINNPELDAYIETLDPETAQEARRLQARAAFHHSQW